LLDPSIEQLREQLPVEVHVTAIEQLTAPARHGDEPRPKMVSQGNYVFGVLLVMRVDRERDLVYHQEIDLVLTRDRVVTVRKTPERGQAFDIAALIDVCRRDGHPPGQIAYLLVDEVAEAYLDLVDDLQDEIDELEDQVEDATNEQVRNRISDLRHDLLRVRKTLAPTRDAVRQVVDNRVELDGGGELFPRDVELHFGDALDKLLRAADALETSRDLLSGVRDYHQAKVANDQNEVMKVLTVIASALLLPTFIVGLYGQNFRHIPELGWAQGYGFSWLLIVLSTAAQLAWFRHKRWI
jgi:magnesium transporter